ncbi:hypothetical protein PUN28_016909 [Cardiocondyla obscurior]|uniref:Uncharacterized protein n=1 Tax=Cardiocondyla obscurior TaxID=286306 RepID=A0AAW2EUJ6_9HYME
MTPRPDVIVKDSRVVTHRESDPEERTPCTGCATTNYYLQSILNIILFLSKKTVSVFLSCFLNFLLFPPTPPNHLRMRSSTFSFRFSMHVLPVPYPQSKVLLREYRNNYGI